jgi:hypothetical protein
LLRQRLGAGEEQRACQSGQAAWTGADTRAIRRKILEQIDSSWYAGSRPAGSLQAYAESTSSMSASLSGAVTMAS